MAMVSGAENQRLQHGAGKRDQNPGFWQSVRLFPRALHMLLRDPRSLRRGGALCQFCYKVEYVDKAAEERKRLELQGGG